MTKCEECGKKFVVDEREEFPEEVDVCYECQREYLKEAVPEAFAETVEFKTNPAFKLIDTQDGCLKIIGPNGMFFDEVFDRPRHYAVHLVSLLNKAFVAGESHEAKKHCQPVPGPPNPPKKIHPPEVG